MSSKEKALIAALEEIARLCRDCQGDITQYAYTVGYISSVARGALRGKE